MEITTKSFKFVVRQITIKVQTLFMYKTNVKNYELKITNLLCISTKICNHNNNKFNVFLLAKKFIWLSFSKHK